VRAYTGAVGDPMNRRIVRLLLCTGVLAAATASGVAFAQNPPNQGLNNNSDNNNNNQNNGSPHPVPEFDPAAVGVIAALVAGGGVLLARRRKPN
jgi:hypothetical protein